MPGKILVDTNVLVYWLDPSERQRHEIAKGFVEKIAGDPGRYVVSRQNLRELASVTLKKTNLEDKEFREKFKTISDTFDEVLTESLEDYVDAFASARAHKMPYWDSLLARTMASHSVHAIITENEKDFRKFPGIMVINPFKSGKSGE